MPIISSLEFDGPAFLAIIEEFVDQFPERFRRIQAAVNSQDFEGLASLAHRLRGSGGSVGFDCFTEPVWRLEWAARERRGQEIPAALEEIASLAGRVAVAE